VQNVEKMDIAGILKTSLCDYPGKVASVIFTSGCNFNCPYCHNHQLINHSKQNIINEKQIFSLLEKRKKHIKHIVISGGEPCINKDIVTFAQTIKEMGFNIKLDTNGSFPNILKELIDNHLLDYVAMDIKAPITNRDTLSEITGITQNIDTLINNLNSSINILKNSSVNYEFRTTLIKEIHSHSDIVKMSLYGQNTYKLQQYNNQNVNDYKYAKYSAYSENEINTICKEIHNVFPLLNIKHQ